MKCKSLDLNTKLEIIWLCEVSGLSKDETGRRCGITSPTMLTVEEYRQNTTSIFRCGKTSNTECTQTTEYFFSYAS
jgi:hypothetical protein